MCRHSFFFFPDSTLTSLPPHPQPPLARAPARLAEQSLGEGDCPRTELLSASDFRSSRCSVAIQRFSKCFPRRKGTCPAYLPDSGVRISGSQNRVSWGLVSWRFHYCAMGRERAAVFWSFSGKGTPCSELHNSRQASDIYIYLTYIYI